MSFCTAWEQTTYNGYLLPRFQSLSGSTGFAVVVAAFSWSFQHVVMPLTFDPDFMIYRLLSPIAHSVFITLVYLRVRRVLPLATAHWVMDGVAAFVGSLWRCCGRWIQTGMKCPLWIGALTRPDSQLG